MNKVVNVLLNSRIYLVIGLAFVLVPIIYMMVTGEREDLPVYTTVFGLTGFGIWAFGVVYSLVRDSNPNRKNDL